MNEQLQDTFRCSVCRKTAKIVGKGNGTLTCCGREMHNVTTDRLNTFKWDALNKKSALIQYLKVLKHEMSQGERGLDEEILVDELIRKNSEIAIRLAESSLSNANKQDLSKLLMSIIDDLWVSALIDYPQYVKQALYESKSEECQIFTKAAILDREAIGDLENILYCVENKKPTKNQGIEQL